MGVTNDLFEDEKCRGSHAAPRHVQARVREDGAAETRALCPHCRRIVPVEVIGGRLRRIAAHRPPEGR